MRFLVRKDEGMLELFRPGRIGKLEIKNRIVMLPMGTRYADEEGFVTDRIIDYYEERARGGAGLIIVEISCVDSPVGKVIRNSLAIDEDKFIPGLAKLAAAIKKHGARAAIQVGHAGNAGRPEITGLLPVGPSPVKRKGLYVLPRELNTGEIQRLVLCFAMAAERAKQAGFDGVEIHGAHMYLVSQFLSAAWNKRDDIYGGNLENRVRFLKEIIASTREWVGEDFPVWCRINAEEEGIPGGTDLAEARLTAEMIQGSIDALSVSASGSGARAFIKTSPDLPGILLPLAGAIKKAVNIPVIAAGRITPEIGKEAIQKGMVDFIGWGRSLISDPELPLKLMEGNTDEIRPCIACLRCYFEAEPIACSVNACAGKEKELKIVPTDRPQKVFVVGGGPAGMEAARVAALRGHRVTLFEKGPQLGGQLLLAHLPPEKKKMIQPLTGYLTNQLRMLGIEVKLGKEVTRQLIDKEKPDSVILATGIIPFVPDIPGMDLAHVVKALDVLAGMEEVGERVVIIGGELVGCETADFLASKGKKVVLVRRGTRMAEKMQVGRRRSLLDRLIEQGVVMLTDVHYEKIVPEGVVITDKAGNRQLIEADSVVVAAGSRPNRNLLEQLDKKDGDRKICSAGDCLDPRGIKEAIEEGYRAAFLLEIPDSD